MPTPHTIDITFLLTPGSPIWPGDTPFSCIWSWDMAKGASVNVSTITTSPHAGTHADTPLHVSPDGAASESLPLESFSGEAVVIDVSDITGEIDLEAITSRTGGHIPQRLLLRTARSITSGEFPESWPSLSHESATACVERGLLLLGTDAPSVDDRDSKTLDVHHALLDHGACVLENLDLRSVVSGSYALEALPMRIAGLDAAPVRALLTPR